MSRLFSGLPAFARLFDVAVVVLICVLAAALLRLVLIFTVDRLARRRFLGDRAAAMFGWVWGVGVAIVVAALVIGFHGRISHEFHQFTKSGGVGGTSHDERQRLTSVANDNRLPLWRVAWREFEKKPVLGQGAGTFENSWDRFGRASAGSVVNAHNLYAENLDTLGIVGTGLLVITILGVLIAALVRARGPSRPVYGAIFAVMVMWALHAAIDWDWQMPVLTIVFFGLGGLVLGRDAPLPAPAPQTASADDPDQAAARRRFARAGVDPFRRGLLGIGCCVLAVAPVYIWLSQRDLDAATNAYTAGNCTQASRDAIASIKILGTRPEAYEALAYCDVARQQPRLGLAAIRKAVSLDPDSWRMCYGLAAVRAAGDLNPRKAARRAIRLYPQSSFVHDQAQQLLRAPPAGWSSTGERLVHEISSL